MAAQAAREPARVFTPLAHLIKELMAYHKTQS